MIVKGNWLTKEVTIDGKPLSPARSLKIANMSPDGFNWGYGGSGPGQLALAILLEISSPDRVARRFFQDFKSEVIAKLPQDDFELSVGEVTNWLIKKIRAVAKARKATGDKVQGVDEGRIKDAKA